MGLGYNHYFVKACGVNISVQVDVFNTKVDSLVNSVCQKIGVNAHDTYALLPMTFYKKVDDTDANTWFSTVNLVPALQTQSHTNPLVVPWLSVSYFLDFASYNIQKVLNHVTATHRENLSYNGAFTSANIIFHNGVVTIQGCLHFANDFLKHAQNNFMLHEVEAAFSFSLEGYLPHILKGISRLAQ
uniref:Uncharacterized protein n=1 Tax=Oryza barthii TaxID=65489 RepID=A0A0D3FF95_9ORYZ